MTTTLSGITPSGRLTLGNYLGALRRFAAAQHEDDGDDQSRAYFFVADLHALTTEHKPDRLSQLSLETGALYLAAGIDPEKSTVFFQSHVREHVELNYLLESTAYVGELGRMIQFKEKGGRPRTRASLFTYPCLMAADILLYDADHVPVGGDQDQHVELARDLALRFNREYGDTFVVPRLVKAALAARVADLAEPKFKMAKSAPDDAAGVIRMLDEPSLIRRKIARAVTDSDDEVRYDPEAKPGVSNLIDILSVINGEPIEAISSRHTRYGELKAECADAVVAELEPIQQRYAELMSDKQTLLATLHTGAERASEQASKVCRRAKEAIGLVS